jgi:hypothetical protein
LVDLLPFIHKLRMAYQYHVTNRGSAPRNDSPVSTSSNCRGAG